MPRHNAAVRSGPCSTREPTCAASHCDASRRKEPGAWQDGAMASDDGELTDAWQRLCTRLGAIGTRLDAEPLPPAGSHHVRDVRHLARQVVLALQGELEHADTTAPSFHRYEEPWAQWGGPNPDNVYTR